MTGKFKGSGLVEFLLWGFGALVCVISYFRIYFGVEITDESYYVSCAYLTSIGGTPFTNDLYFQQAASLLYEPVLYLYHSLFGSTGIILFVRHLYFLLSLGCAGSFYFLFRRFIKPEYAFLIAILPVSFVPYSIPSLSYNTIGSLCFGIGIAFMLAGFFEEKKWKMFCGGAFFAVASFGYPTFGVGAFLLGLFILFLHWREKNNVLWSIAGSYLFSGCLFVLFWGITLFRFGYGNLELSYKVTMAFGALGSAAQKVTNSINMYKAYTPDLWVVLVVLVGGVVARIRFSLSWFWPMTITSLIFIYEASIADSLANIFITFICLMGCPVIALYERIKSPEWRLAILLFSTSFLMALLVLWTSSQILYAAALASQCAVLSILFLCCCGSSRKATIAGLVVFQCINVYLSYNYVYREDRIVELTAFIKNGPYAGLLTSPEKLKIMDQIGQDIQTVKVNAKSILFYDSFPGGYLYSDLRPATPSMFIHPLPYGYLMRELYSRYFSNSSNWPDVFFQFESFPFHIKTPEQFRNQFTVPPTDNFYDMLPKTGAYNLLFQRANYKVWKRKGL
jgi:hypothetical protein